MKSGRGRTITAIVVFSGLLVLLAAGWVLKGVATEQWYLWKLESEDEKERELAIDKLAASDPERVIPGILKSVIKQNEPPFRGPADEVIARIGPDRAVPILLREMARICITPINIDDDKAFEEHSAITDFILHCCRSFGPTAVPRILEILKNHKNSELRLQALVILGNMAASKDLGPLAEESSSNLLKALKEDEAWQVRKFAAMMIGEFEPVDTKTLAALQRALEDKSESVRLAAAKALEKVQEKAGK